MIRKVDFLFPYTCHVLGYDRQWLGEEVVFGCRRETALPIAAAHQKSPCLSAKQDVILAQNPPAGQAEA